ncbi:MAG: Hsp70 family protein [Acidobacteriota bacterium]
MSSESFINRCYECGAPVNFPNAQGHCEYCGISLQPREGSLARALRIETAGDVASILLPTGTLLPASVTEIFSTSLDNQNSVGIHLLEGDEAVANKCRNLGWFVLENISPGPRGVPQVQVLIEVTAEGEMSIDIAELANENRQRFRGPRLAVRKKQ